MLFEMDKLSEKDTYKLLVSTVVPRPIAWVVTQDLDGAINAAPYSFFNAVSGNPPIVTFGIGGRGPGDAKDTGNNIRRTGQFVVNLVNNATAEAMNAYWAAFAKYGKPGAAGGPAWPAWTPDKEAYIEFSASGPIIEDHLQSAGVDWAEAELKGSAVAKRSEF